MGRKIAHDEDNNWNCEATEMNVTNQVLRTAEDMQALLDQDIEGSVVMVHLLKYNTTAEYADGRDTTLTGGEAYEMYRGKMIERATSAGGHLVYSGVVGHLVLGDVEDMWDEVMVVEFPSKEAFVDIISSPEMAEWGAHRRAGLAGQLLIATTARG